jgi:hypothetical protein
MSLAFVQQFQERAGKYYPLPTQVRPGSSATGEKESWLVDPLGLNYKTCSPVWTDGVPDVAEGLDAGLERDHVLP